MKAIISLTRDCYLDVGLSQLETIFLAGRNLPDKFTSELSMSKFNHDHPLLLRTAKELHEEFSSGALTTEFAQFSGALSPPAPWSDARYYADQFPKAIDWHQKAKDLKESLNNLLANDDLRLFS